MPRKVMKGRGAYKPKRSYSARPPVSGRGFYKGFGADLGKAIGSALGMGAAALGAPGLGGVLANAGEKIGGFAASKTGFGAYNLPLPKHNTILKPQLPTVMNNKSYEGAVVVRHKEYIGEVLGSEDFTVQYQIALNPGLQAAFPWLSPIANQFQQYRWNGVLFEFRTTCGQNVTTGSSTALGSVSMATDYNALTPEFNSLQQMLNTEFATSQVPTVNQIAAIECAPKQTSVSQLYTRYADVPPGGDPRLYDLGVFTLATSGQPTSGDSIGQLWVTYEVLLFKPILTSELGLTASTAAYTLNNIDETHLWGTSQTKVADAIGVEFDYTSLVGWSKLVLPVNTSGTYVLNFQCDTGFDADMSGLITLGNASYVNLFQVSGATTAGRCRAYMSGSGMFSIAFEIDNPAKQTYIQITNGTWIPVGATGSIQLWQLNPQ